MFFVWFDTLKYYHMKEIKHQVNNEDSNRIMKQHMNISNKKDNNRDEKGDKVNPEFHRALVESIFYKGLQTCSPSVLIDEMHFKADCITSER